MERFAFVNGAIVPLGEARVSIMDRGFLFGDGVYEVSAVLRGRLVDNAAHLRRLARSLGEIGLANPYTEVEWVEHQEAVIRHNRLEEGLIYLEVTRGVAERDFPFPRDGVPTVVMFTQAKNNIETPIATTGVSAITVPDLRWARRDIKSVALLAQVLAKQAAVEAGAHEAIMVENDLVTEGASSTIFAITAAGTLVTRPLSQAVLAGITRRAVLRLAAEHDLAVEERAITVAECRAAAEVFYTSASSFVIPIIRIDGDPIGAGVPGPLTRRLRAIYVEEALRSLSTE